MSTEVLLLNRSLQNLLSTETLGLHLGMFEIANNFLIPGPYAREKGQFARKVCLQLHPIMIRSTLRQISYTQFFNFFYVQYKASIVTFCKKKMFHRLTQGLITNGSYLVVGLSLWTCGKSFGRWTIDLCLVSLKSVRFICTHTIALNVSFQIKL